MALNSYYFLVNPYSGGYQGRKLIQIITNLIEVNIIKGEVHELDLNNLDQQINSALNHDALLIAGGDGTISLIFSKLTNSNIPVGVLPLGTGNDLARELNIYPYFSITEPEKLLNLFNNAEVKKLTIWKLEYDGGARTFVNYLSFGFDAEVVCKFTSWRESKYYALNKFGKYGNRILYTLAGIPFLGKFLDLKNVEINDHENKTIKLNPCVKTLLFSNIKSIIGIGKSNSVSNYSDHKLELISINSIFNYLGIISNLFLFAPKVIASSESWRIKYLEHNSKIQVDGEAVNDINSTEYFISKSHEVSVFTLNL